MEYIKTGVALAVLPFVAVLMGMVLTLGIAGEMLGLTAEESH